MTRRNLVKSIAIFLTLLTFFYHTAFVFAATQQDLNNKKAQQQQAQAQADQKAKEAAQVKSQIGVIDGQISEIQAALNKTNSDVVTSQATIDDLGNQIKDQETKLAAEKTKLNEVISSWYMEGNVGFFETLFSSDSLSAMVSKQQYYDSIKQQVTLAMNQINELKAKLDAQKADQQKKMADLTSLQQQQVAYRKSVDGQKSLKTQLLGMTQAQQQTYLATVSKLQKEIASISAELYARRRAGSSGTAGSLGYPNKVPPDVYILDEWSFYMSECTGYAAWYWNERLGRRWYRGEGEPGTGDASNWPNLAARNGVSVHSSPQVGAIISWQAGALSSQWGHVAIVEGINSDGTIDVSEYNWFYKHDGDTVSHLNPSSRGPYSYIY